MPTPLENSIANVLHGECAQRGLGRGFPNGGIAADRGQECVPRPHGYGKIERGDDAHNAQRVPLLVHAMLRAFRVHRIPIQHARLSHREIGDIDHLLHFTIAFSLDLAVFHRHQAAERIFKSSQLLADLTHGLAALWRGNLPPSRGRGDRRSHDMLVVGGRRTAHLCQALTVRRVDRFDQRARCVGAPAVAAGPNAGIDVPKSQGFEGLAAVLHSSSRFTNAQLRGAAF